MILRLLTALALLTAAASAQTKTVNKTISNNGLTENLTVPSGKTLTIASGATITAATGSTITGFTASATWGGILGTLSAQTDLQSALDLKLASATAASTYQPLATPLTNFANLSNGSGVLTNNGSGTLSYTATSTGGNTLGLDAGKIAVYSDSGELKAASALRLTAGLSVMGIWFNDGGSVPGRLTFSPSGFGSRTWTLPNVSGTVITTGDTGTVTNDMLAGSIALSKLTITGTPDGTQFLRDDGSWQTVNLSAYLPLAGGTLTGALAITQGAANTGLLSSTGYSLTGSNATSALDIAGTLNTSGNPNVLQVAMTTTAAGSTTALARFLGTTTGNANVFAVLAPVANAQASAAIQIGAGSFCGEYTASSSLWFGFSSNKFTGRFAIDSIGVSVANNGYYAFGGDAFASSSCDLFIRRDAAARLQLGTDSATPISQQIKTADGSGSNIAASNLTLGGSLSTGTGAGGDVIEVTSMSGSSGTSANTTQTRRQTIGRFINLTEGTATNVASIALPSGKVTGGTATLTVWASDGTDHQALTSEIRFSAVNKAGTLTATTSQTDGTTAASAGTLTVTYDATASGANLLLRANATSSLTQTTLRCRLVITALNGDDVQTVTPQ
jgi:hypothetical protein